MRLLLVTTRFPLPPWRGQQVRTVEWLEALKGHEIRLVCPGPDGEAEAVSPVLDGVDLRLHRSGYFSTAFAALWGSVAGLPVQEGMYRTGPAKTAVREALNGWTPDVVIVQMVRCGWVVDILRRQAPDVPVLFDAIDAMGLHFDRAAGGFPAPGRPFARFEARRCRLRERDLAERSHMTAAVTPRDLAAIGVPHGRGVVIPVAGRQAASARRPAEQPTILLSGNLGYRPTVASVLWFAEEVWPGVSAGVPGCRWILAGARPPRAIRDLGARRGIEVHADVPDLGPFLAESWVALAPMASGSGVPMKVLEAWAAGVPVVVNPWTAGGIEEQARSALCQARSAGEWIKTINDLLHDRQSRADLAAKGADAWRRFYHPDRVAEQIRRAVGGLSPAHNGREITGGESRASRT